MTKRLNLGCGTRFLPEWVNCDFRSNSSAVISHDLRKPLPFHSGEFELVYHSHVLEHLTHAEALGFLQECRRVLSPSGVLRVVVPDLESQARSYLAALEQAVATGAASAVDRYDWTLIELIDQMTRERPGGEMRIFMESNRAKSFVQERIGDEYEKVLATAPATDHSTPGLRNFSIRGRVKKYLNGIAARRLGLEFCELEVARFRGTGELHKWMYDRLSLRRLLEVVGFEQIAVRDAQTSSSEDWKNNGLWLDWENSQPRKPFSLYMEACGTKHVQQTRRAGTPQLSY